MKRGRSVPLPNGERPDTITDIRAWVERVGGRYSVALGIDLTRADPEGLSRWLLAACLFGAPISEALAENTYRAFQGEGALLPGELAARGWHGLVAILDRGGYVRYDFKTATKLLEVSGNVLAGYGGDLNRLHAQAQDTADLEARLKALAEGIGPVTVGIFLRELRGIWDKADPLPSERVVAAAKALGLLPRVMDNPRDILERLQQCWHDAGGDVRDFPDFEAALVRYAIGLRARGHRRDAPGRPG